MLLLPLFFSNKVFTGLGVCVEVMTCQISCWTHRSPFRRSRSDLTAGEGQSPPASGQAGAFFDSRIAPVLGKKRERLLGQRTNIISRIESQTPEPEIQPGGCEMVVYICHGDIDLQRYPVGIIGACGDHGIRN